MEVIGLICIIIGGIIGLVYGLQILIMAFSESILWGLGYMFIPFVSLIFLVMFWEQTKSPFLKSLLAIPFMIVGVALTPTSAGY